MRTTTTHRPSTTMNVQRRHSAKRPTRTRAASPSATVDDDRHDLVIQQSMDQIAVRNVFGLIEKFDKWETCELLTQRDAHWLLTSSDIYKVDISILSLS